MTAIFKTALALAALAALAACTETEGGSAVMQPTPGAPFLEGSFSASNAAVAACQNALAAQTQGGVRVVGSESSEAAHGRGAPPHRSSVASPPEGAAARRNRASRVRNSMARLVLYRACTNAPGLSVSLYTRISLFTPEPSMPLCATSPASARQSPLQGSASPMIEPPGRAPVESVGR